MNKNDSISSSPNGQAKPNLWLEEIKGVSFVTDGQYKCPEVKGRYTIRLFQNPSGRLIPSLQGYRPKEVLCQQVDGNITIMLINEAGGRNQKSNRYRKNFDTLKEADGQRETLIREDANCAQRTNTVDTTLQLEQVKDAEAAFAKLHALPPPDWTEAGWNLAKAVEYVVDHFKPCRNHKPLPEAVAAFIENKDKDCNRASATLDSLRFTLGRLVAACPGKCVHQVTVDEVRPLIRRGTQVKSMRRLKSIYHNFFAWCADKERSWIPTNPAAEVGLPDRTDDVHIPKILPVEVVRDLLTQALKFKGGRLFLFCAVAFGCALRPSEMGRIQARRKIFGKDSFHFGQGDIENYIEIIGKCRGWRKVPIPPEFVTCIQAFVEAGYPLIPRNFFNDWTHLRALVGYLGSKGYVPDYIDAKSLVPWVSDYPRHTGGSHHFNRSENEHKTARWMGNSPKMLFGHYDGRPTQMDTVEFYRIPIELKLPTVAELLARGVPEMATDSELKKLKCPVSRHTTFGLKKAEFEQLCDLSFSQCLKATRSEIKGFTRKPGIWGKRRMLDLPPREELLKLIWTFTLEDLAKRYKVTRATMAHIASDHKISLPGIGHWQQRASGKVIGNLPEEVKRAFPNGLPPYVAPVGRTKMVMPAPADLFKLLWQYRQTDLISKLQCSTRTLERAIKRFNLPKPGHSYWHTKPEKRIIPDHIKPLLTLDSAQLEMELAKNTRLPPMDL